MNWVPPKSVAARTEWAKAHPWIAGCYAGLLFSAIWTPLTVTRGTGRCFMTKGLRFLLVVAVLAGGACGRLARHPGAGGSTPGSETPQATTSPVTQVQITEVKYFADVGVTISPPPANSAAALSPEAIVTKADSTYNPGPSTTRTIALGSLTYDRGSDILAWIVHYSRPCHSSTEELCTTRVNDYKAYNADSGEWITTWEIIT